jgi:hypothetical protein
LNRVGAREDVFYDGSVKAIRASPSGWTREPTVDHEIHEAVTAMAG